MNDEFNLAKYIGARIRFYRIENKMTQDDLGKLIGTKKSTISNYETGYRSPQQDVIFDIAEALNVSINDLFPPTTQEGNITYIYNQLEPPRQQKVYQFTEYQLSEQQKVVNMEDYITERLIGYVSAGTGEYQTEEINEEVKLPKSIIPEQRYDMVLKVNGTSMEPMFQDGEFIFVRKDEDFRSGQIGVFIIDGESYLKKAYIEDSHIRLVSLNKGYEDLIFTDDSRIELIGTVVM